MDIQLHSCNIPWVYCAASPTNVTLGKWINSWSGGFQWLFFVLLLAYYCYFLIRSSYVKHCNCNWMKMPGSGAHTIRRIRTELFQNLHCMGATSVTKWTVWSGANVQQTWTTYRTSLFLFLAKGHKWKPRIVGKTLNYGIISSSLFALSTSAREQGCHKTVFSFASIDSPYVQESIKSTRFAKRHITILLRLQACNMSLTLQNYHHENCHHARRICQVIIFLLQETPPWDGLKQQERENWK